MTKLRMEQWKNEPADLFAMRCFAKALPHCKPHEAIAAANWIMAIAGDARTWEKLAPATEGSEQPRR